MSREGIHQGVLATNQAVSSAPEKIHGKFLEFNCEMLLLAISNYTQIIIHNKLQNGMISNVKWNCTV